ncbi:thioredoxin-like protein [Powellomyces hirtus]|nr:thioredoxin-like protein [Powellomyces hirtus]
MNANYGSDESDDDELFRELERDDDSYLAAHREQRIDELKREMQKLEEAKTYAYGTYETISTESEVLKITTTTKNCVVHFAHKNFRRCQLMDTHLNEIARKHQKTRFVRIDVENAPFLVEKLKVQVLPCVIPFIDGASVDRLIGFELVGDSDNVPTSAIETWLRNTKVLDLPVLVSRGRTIFGFADAPAKDNDSDDDY